jgi:hypothetical protein
MGPDNKCLDTKGKLWGFRKSMGKRFFYQYKRIPSLLLIACSNNNQTQKSEIALISKTENMEQIPANKEMHFEIKTYLNTNKLKGWGYDIYVNNALYIHQPHIPAFSGEKGI